MRMKKFLIKPLHLVLAVLLLALVIAGGAYAYQKWDSPYRNLPAAERQHREKVDTFENCLSDAKDQTAREQCLIKYPDV